MNSFVYPFERYWVMSDAEKCRIAFLFRSRSRFVLSFHLLFYFISLTSRWRRRWEKAFFLRVGLFSPHIFTTSRSFSLSLGVENESENCRLSFSSTMCNVMYQLGATFWPIAHFIVQSSSGVSSAQAGRSSVEYTGDKVKKIRHMLRCSPVLLPTRRFRLNRAAYVAINYICLTFFQRVPQ